MPKPAPNFALLIGKPKGSAVDHEKDLGLSDDGMDQAGAEDSAVKDLLSAVKQNDPDTFKQALKDFLEICYPQLSDNDSEQDEGSADESDPSDSEAY